MKEGLELHDVYFTQICEHLLKIACSEHYLEHLDQVADATMTIFERAADQKMRHAFLEVGAFYRLIP